MSQTNRTPAGPERGSVATGQHTPQRNGEGDSGNGRVVDAAVEPATEGADTARAEESAVTGADIVASEAPASDGDEPRTPDATATAKFRVPLRVAPATGRARNRPPGPSRRLRRWTRRRPCLRRARRPPSRRRGAACRATRSGRPRPPRGRTSCSTTARRPSSRRPRFTAPSPTRDGEPAAGETGGWARATRSRPPRQAALQLRRLDPWSVLKLALVLAVVLFFIWLVAVGVLYGVLDGMGVWDRLNGTYADLVSGEAQTGSTLISAGRVFGLAAVIGAINSLLFAVAVTVGAFVYNVSADLVGGIEVTLSERD